MDSVGDIQSEYFFKTQLFMDKEAGKNLQNPRHVRMKEESPSHRWMGDMGVEVVDTGVNKRFVIEQREVAY